MKCIPLLLAKICMPAIAASALLSCPATHAAYSCFVSQANSLGVTYPTTNSSINTTGNVVLTCTRDVQADAATMAYSIRVDSGQNYLTYRMAKLVGGASYLKYTLRKSTAAGGTATCGTTDTWSTTSPISGTLNFGAAANASVTRGYCLRVRRCNNSASNCNIAAPTAGAYTDQALIDATYSTANTVTPPTPMTYTVGVTSYCELSRYFSVLPFVYTAFGPAVTSSNTLSLKCSNGLPWTLTVTPTSSVLQGLQYTLGLGPSGGPFSGSYSGTGSGGTQSVTLSGALPAGQAGTCGNATGTCTAVQQHTLTLTY